MTRHGCGRLWWLLGVLLAAPVVPQSPAVAREPTAEFLQALREAGYFDTALDYLERLQTSPLASAQARETVPYEIGALLIEAARSQRDLTTRERQLDQARVGLERFVSQSPDHALAPAARIQLGSVIVERGRIKVEQAKKPRPDQAALLAEARKRYEEAYQLFARTQAELKAKLDKLKIVAPDDKQNTELRERFQSDFAQAQLLAAAIQEESAETAAAGSADYQRFLKEAATAYGQIHEKYRMKLVGLYARLYQARCQLRLGKVRDALSLLADLLDEPDNPPEVRRLKAEAFLLATEAWPQHRPPLWAEAVSRLAPFVESARAGEGREELWVKLRLELAKAQWALAQELQARDARDPQVKRLQSDARKHLLFVSRQGGQRQQETQQLLASWGGPSSGGGEAEKTPPLATFAEAQRAGTEALDALQTATLVLTAVPARLTKETDEAVKKDLRQQLEEARRTADAASARAERCFARAVSLAGREAKVPVDDLNLVRYFLCYLHYTDGDYYGAAAIGEFVARRFPRAASARECAKIAMAAFAKLYADAGEDRKFESGRIVALADYITKQWPEEPEAGEALGMLIPLMIREGKLDAAEGYLQSLPADSPKRADAEIKMGQAMWSLYLRGLQEVRRWEADPATAPPSADVAARRAALEPLRTRAQKTLAAAVSRLQTDGRAGESATTAALSLAQIYVDTGQADKAIELLEHAQVGPLTLVQKGDLPAEQETLAAETYKTALRAYISVLPSAADPQAAVAKAIRLMDAMKAAVPDDKLIGIYVGLAHDLEEQMKLAAPQARQTLSRGFEAFLVRIRESATEFGVLNWVAATFSSMGSSFWDEEQKLTPDAKKYYQEAAATYRTILEKSTFAEPRQKAQVQLQYALTQRRLNGFLEAKRLYLEILRPNAMLVNVQMEAARMYEEWAAFPGKEALYEKAIRGAEPEGQKNMNVIWGWAHLASVLARHTKFRDQFHEARYHLALCRYRWARAQQTKPEQGTLFEKAKQDILRTQELFGLGPEWEAWKPRYDALLKNIQKDLGQEPVGLPTRSVAKAALPSRDATSP